MVQTIVTTVTLRDTAEGGGHFFPPIGKIIKWLKNSQVEEMNAVYLMFIKPENCVGIFFNTLKHILWL